MTQKEFDNPDTLDPSHVGSLVKIMIPPDDLVSGGGDNIWAEIVEVLGPERAKLKCLNTPVCSDGLQWGDIIEATYEEGIPGLEPNSFRYDETK